MVALTTRDHQVIQPETHSVFIISNVTQHIVQVKDPTVAVLQPVDLQPVVCILFDKKTKEEKKAVSEPSIYMPMFLFGIKAFFFLHENRKKYTLKCKFTEFSIIHSTYKKFPPLGCFTHLTLTKKATCKFKSKIASCNGLYKHKLLRKCSGNANVPLCFPKYC